MGDLTAHFSRWEFESRDGAPMPPVALANIKKTAVMLESLRAEISEVMNRDCPLKVLSGYRSPAHNAAVGGVKTSYHLTGMAADVVCRYASPWQIARIARRLQDRGVVGGVGEYFGFVHVDWGPKRSWTEASREAQGGAPKGGDAP